MSIDYTMSVRHAYNERLVVIGHNTLEATLRGLVHKVVAEGPFVDRGVR